MPQIIKIGLVGPESTGKSTLSAALANHFAGTCIPEYARAYIGALQRPYTYEDVCHIAEQNRHEANSSSPLSFFDTELIITKVWLDVVYHRRPEWITDPIPADCQMDFYLLLAPDIEAEPDPLRENIDQPARERLFQIYRSEIQSTGRPFAVISGQGKEREQNAVRLLRSFLTSQLISPR